MKIYYEFEASDKEKLGEIQGGYFDLVMDLTCKILKYQLLWHLRGMETEIEAEDGCIIISIIKGSFETSYAAKGYSFELTDKMNKILKGVTPERPFDILDSIPGL